MSEEQNINPNPMEADYLSQIQQLKDNTVSKDDYNRMAEENRKLLKTIVEGGSRNDPEPAAEAVDFEKLRSDFFNPDNNNLKFAERALKLRKALIDAGEDDPFAPNGIQIHSTTEDYAAAERVAEVLEECVNAANGSSEVFTAELQRRTKDSAPFRR